MRDPQVAILGGSGLIGHAISLDLLIRRRGVVSIARRFSAAQKRALGTAAVEAEIIDMPREALWRLVNSAQADTIINCVGVLQDSAFGDTDETHRKFAADLVDFCARDPQKLLVHISIPGNSGADRTPFSRSKRAGEEAILASAAPYVIIRPGFVIAPAAYGGSAMFRALAMLPVRLPPSLSRQTFGTTDIRDLCATIAFVVNQSRSGFQHWATTWDVIEENPSRLNDVLDAFRNHFGGPMPVIPIPGWLLTASAAAGDAVSWLGWRPPLRSTAIAELHRGVAGDPAKWIQETGITPANIDAMLMRLPVTVQEKWFARLYLLKPFAIGILALFWCASGLIPLTASFDASATLLTSHGFAAGAAYPAAWAGSLADLATGCAIAFRPSCRFGLIAGLLLSLIYAVAGTIVAPDLWLDPLGAMTKVLPIAMLMLLSLALLQDR